MRSRLFPIINTCHKPCFRIGPIKLEMKTKISIPDFEWVFNNWGCPICSEGTYFMPQWNTHTVIYIYLLNHSFKMRSCYFTQLNPIYTHASQFVFLPLLPPRKTRFASGKDSDVAESRQSRSAQSGNNPRTPVSRQVDNRSGTVLVSQTVLETYQVGYHQIDIPFWGNRVLEVAQVLLSFRTGINWTCFCSSQETQILQVWTKVYEGEWDARLLRLLVHETALCLLGIAYRSC